MAQAFHVTPITPNAFLEKLAGRAFCVTYVRPDQLTILLRIAAFLMVDNGAFNAFTRGRVVNWNLFYAWLESFIFHPGRWFVIPDVIGAGGQLQDALLRECPPSFIGKGAPVYHMDEPLDRLRRLCGEFGRICIGSTGDYWKVGSALWWGRMAEIANVIEAMGNPPQIHGLRMLAVAGKLPFIDTADASSGGQNGHRYDAPMDEILGEKWRGRIAYFNHLERIAA